MLGAFDLILAQDGAVAARLAALGGRVEGRLNLKRLGAPLAADAAELARLKAAVGDAPVVLAAQHPRAGGGAGRRRGPRPAPRAAADPRAPPSGARRRTSPASSDRRVARRHVPAAAPADPPTSTSISPTPWARSGLLCRLADVAVMGGGFRPRRRRAQPAGAGAAWRRASSPAPDVANHADVFAEMAAAGGGAAWSMTTGGPRPLCWRRCWTDPGRRRAMGARGLAFAERQDGQLGLALAAIGPLLPARPAA